MTTTANKYYNELTDWLESQCWWKLARERWPGITYNTRIVNVPVTKARSVIEPVLLGSDGGLCFGQEEIEMGRVAGCEPVIKLGYGPKTNTLICQRTDVLEGPVAE